MKTFIIFIICISTQLSLSAAELPQKGITHPISELRPDNPPNPPVGNGIALVAVFGILYTIKKHRAQQ